jgi:predicted enzyme related to lactoylglutathione lyase
MPDTMLRGRFIWHELMTTDPDAAARFYPAVTGWGIQSWEHDPSYRMWTVQGVPMGGLMRVPEDARQMGAPPSWLMYVGVPDVDATVRDAAARGARTFVPPRDLPMGRFAVLADPQGATFAVYQPGQPQSGGDEAAVGSFSWHELATTDWRAGWDFYKALFGWGTTEAMDMGPAGVYQMFGLAGRTLGGIYGKPADQPGPPAWLCYVRVPDADRAVAAAQRAGGTLLNGPMEVPGGDRIAQLLDPQGAAFAVHSLAAQAAARPPSARAKRPKEQTKKKTRKAASKKPAAAKRKAGKRPTATSKRRARKARRTRRPRSRK